LIFHHGKSWLIISYVSMNDIKNLKWAVFPQLGYEEFIGVICFGWQLYGHLFP